MAIPRYLRSEMDHTSRDRIATTAREAHPIVRRIVGELHVSESYSTVRAAIRAALSPKGRRDATMRRAAYRQAMCCHLVNLWLCQDVNAGAL